MNRLQGYLQTEYPKDLALTFLKSFSVKYLLSGCFHTNQIIYLATYLQYILIKR